MPLQTAPAQECRSKFKSFAIRAGSVLVVLLVIFACLMPTMDADAASVRRGAGSNSGVLNEENSRWSSVIEKLKEAEDESDIKSIMGKYYIPAVNLDSDTMAHLVTIFCERADELKGSWAGLAFWWLQDWWSDNNLQDLVDNYEYYFPGFIGEMIYNYAYIVSNYGNIDVSTLEKMAGTITMIDLIEGTADVGGHNLGTYEGMLGLGEDSFFEIRSGVSLSDVLSDTDNAFKALLVGAVASSYSGAITSITNTTDQTANLLTESITGTHTVTERGHTHVSTTNENNRIIYDTAKDICTKVMVPIAAVVLAFVFAYDIYELVCERNNMNEIGAGPFVQLILKIVIAILLIAYAWNLCGAVFNIGSLIVRMAEPIAESNGMTSNEMLSTIDNYIEGGGYRYLGELSEESETKALQWILAVQICLNSTIDFGGMLVMLIQGIIINVGVWVLSLIIYIIVYVRLIEIYMYCCISPIPLATLTNRSWQQTGLGFIRSLFALALQAFIIYLCLVIFNVITSNALNGIMVDADITGTMWSVIGYSLILAFCLFKSGGLSKTIMGAH